MGSITQETRIDMKNLDKTISIEGEKKMVEKTGQTKKKQRISFFGSMSKNVETTWVISVFVFIHIVAFISTMIVNNCGSKSHGDCTFFFFQPFSENPFLGPSYSILDRMGALRRVMLTKHHGLWRLFTSPFLHAGLLHLIVSLLGIIYVGITLEQKYGPLRIGIIYALSSITGSLMATLFVQNIPEVCSSAALFGLIGAAFSGLIRDWKSYDQKLLATVILLVLFGINFALGMLPFINNFSNIAGFISGFLLGCILFFHPQLRKQSLEKGFFDYEVKHYVALKDKFDRPVLRIVFLILFIFMLIILIVTAIWGIDVNKYCIWCRYLDCLPSKSWICDVKTAPCKVNEIRGQTLLRCLESDNFKILPFTKVSKTRVDELCSMICT